MSGLRRNLSCTLAAAAAGTILLLTGAAMSNAQELPDFDKLWDYDKPADTEKAFRELLPEAEASGDASYHLQLLTQIARTLGLQQKFDEAHALLDRVEKETTDDYPVVKIRCLLERGRTLRSSGKPEESKPHFLEALEIADSAGEDFYAVDAAHMLGIIGIPEEQLQWNLKAMALAESSESDRARGWLGALYNNIGWTYHEMGDYEKALETFRKGYDFRVAKGQERETRIAKWTIARALRSLERIDEALKIQYELLGEWEKAGEPDGFVFEEIGECLLVLGKADEARPHFRKAYELLQEYNWVEKERLDRLQKLGAE